MNKKTFGKLLAVFTVLAAAGAAIAVFLKKFGCTCDCFEDDWDDEFDDDFDDDFEAAPGREYVNITPVAPEDIVSENDDITTMEEAMETEVQKDAEEPEK